MVKYLNCCCSLEQVSLRALLARTYAATGLLRSCQVTQAISLNIKSWNQIDCRLQPGKLWPIYITQSVLPVWLTFRSFSRDKNDKMAEAATSLKKESFGGYRNRLGLEKSPYLLQHANNPVDW